MNTYLQEYQKRGFKEGDIIFIEEFNKEKKEHNSFIEKISCEKYLQFIY